MCRLLSFCLLLTSFCFCIGHPTSGAAQEVSDADTRWNIPLTERVRAPRLIDEGYVKAYTDFSPKRDRLFKAAEERAKAAGTGPWSACEEN